MSAFLVDRGQSFDLMLADKNNLKIDRQAVGIVVSGAGVISNFKDSVLDVPLNNVFLASQKVAVHIEQDKVYEKMEGALWDYEKNYTH